MCQGGGSVSDTKPGYYAVIPADVRYDASLPANAKLLYGEISALIGADGFCYASNQYFSNLFGMAEETISRLIAKLEKAGHILRELIRDDSGQVVQRRLYLRVSAPEAHPLDEIVNTSPQKKQEGIDEKVKDTNLSITNISKRKNKKEKSPKPVEPELTLEELKPLIVENVRKMGAEKQWPSDTMNQVYMELVNFYSPRAIKNGKAPPVKSSRGLNSLCNKLMRESKGNPNVVLSALDDAIAAGWTTAHPKPGNAGAQPPTQKQGRRYEEV